jgi:hypothetical protein
VAVDISLIDLTSGSLERGSNLEVYILILHSITANGCIKDSLGVAEG